MSRVLRHNARRGNRRRVDEIHHLLICSGATDEHSWVISTQSWPPRRFAPPFERVSVERAQKVSRNSVPVNDDDRARIFSRHDVGASIDVAEQLGCSIILAHKRSRLVRDAVDGRKIVETGGSHEHVQMIQPVQWRQSAGRSGQKWSNQWYAIM